MSGKSATMLPIAACITTGQFCHDGSWQWQRRMRDAVSIPVIASGGVGGLQDLVDGIKIGGADAVLAASIFHYGEYTVQEAKRFMADQQIPMRLA